MGLDLSTAFGSNERAEIEGVKVPLGGGAWVQIARLGNPEAQRAYRALPARVRRAIEAGLMEDEEAIVFLNTFLANNIVKDWGELADGGKPIKFSLENAAKMLKKHRRFRERCWEISTDDELFNIGDLEEDAKNSPPPSSGT